MQNRIDCNQQAYQCIWRIINIKNTTTLHSFQKKKYLHLVQFDANLIEGEPYNRLTQKIKWDWSGPTNFKYTRNTGNRFESPPKQTVSVWGPVLFCRHTDFFSCPPTHPWVKKCHSLTFNTKLRLQLTTRTALVHDKKMCLHSKRFKNYFKINQSNWTCTDAVMKHMRGRGKKAVVFSPKKQVIN